MLKYHIDDYNFDTILLLKNDRLYQKSEAIIEILNEIPRFVLVAKLLGLLPSSLLNFGYDLVAKSRYGVFGKRNICRIPTPEEKLRFL